MNLIYSSDINAELNSMLDKFVELNKGMKQRDENWYKSMATTIGGSEIASLLAISENEELRIRTLGNTSHERWTNF